MFAILVAIIGCITDTLQLSALKYRGLNIGARILAETQTKYLPVILVKAILSWFW